MRNEGLYCAACIIPLHVHPFYFCESRRKIQLKLPQTSSDVTSVTPENNVSFFQCVLGIKRKAQR